MPADHQDAAYGEEDLNDPRHCTEPWIVWGWKLADPEEGHIHDETENGPGDADEAPPACQMHQFQYAVTAWRGGFAAPGKQGPGAIRGA